MSSGAGKRKRRGPSPDATELTVRIHSFMRKRLPDAQSLTPEQEQAIRIVMRRMHELLVPPVLLGPEDAQPDEEDSSVSASDHEGLTPDATSVFTIERVVGLVASFLSRTGRAGGAALTRDLSSLRLMNRNMSRAFARTVESFSYRIDKYRPGVGLHTVLHAFPNMDSLRLTGTSKGCSRSIEVLLNTVAGTQRPIRRFAVDNQGFSQVSVRKLAELCKSGGFSHLEVLRFRHAKTDQGGLKDLCNTWSKSQPGDYLPRLTSLSLHSESLGDDCMLQLIDAWEAGLAPSLHTLDLRQNCLGNRSFMRLVDAMERGTFPSLRALLLGVDGDNWRANKPDVSCLIALAEALGHGACAQLSELDLFKLPITDAVAEAFISCAERGALRSLKAVTLCSSSITASEATIQRVHEALGVGTLKIFTQHGRR